MPSLPTLRDVVATVEARYPVALASQWDAVGLVCGDPDATVRRVLWAVDPAPAVVDEALMLGADLVITHHPLFLRGVHTVAATTPGGSVVHTLITHGIALLCAHTNADYARPGVSDALADLLGVTATRPLVPTSADPTVGSGRVGTLDEPLTLDQFARRVAERLPATVQGIRVAGDGSAVVRTVAVGGGSGDSALADAAQVADVYVTSDLRHHRALDHRLAGGCALIDVAHWAGEWPWLPVAAARLADDLAAAGTTVEVHVSTIPTDPWTAHVGSPR